MQFDKSITAFEKAQEGMPGGVNSPARAFKSVKSNPVFISNAKGSKITDIDGNTYIDYVGSWGPMILGHAYEPVIEAVKEAAMRGTSYGAPTEIETTMAELIKEMVPSVEMIRMVNSGTEATMSALRLARGYTGRNLVLKFEGCYHGHGDSFLIKAGSGALTLGTPDSPGITPGTARDTLMAAYNDLDAVEKVFAEKGKDIAAVILEPVTGNMGVIRPKKSFVTGLRNLCDTYGAVLIFDEVMTGFRLSRSGAQGICGIKPDLTTFGKIIGGGLPVGAYGGKREIMEQLAPLGPVYQAGTLSGNPLAMTAGYVTLKTLNDKTELYEELEKKSDRLVTGFRNNLTELGIPAVINRVGSMFTVFFTRNEAVSSFADVQTCDTSLFADYFNGSLQQGIYYAPSQFEAVFVSMAHSDEDIEMTIKKNFEVMKGLKK
ncbi:glutamate-1-semialdehyde 2,1-aminomutase [Saccharicrinis sp. FJH62]|uniref:glutamate-1-semialdehyde 2,1-aminomutase n=1 Tax=Saccharicrinis sp. FJH62 TaxID=3344657 RepID=UPI0035D47C3A